MFYVHFEDGCLLGSSLVEVYQRFRGPCCLCHEDLIALMLEAARISDTLVNFYQTTRRYNRP
jgi:hypothetical protein